MLLCCWWLLGCSHLALYFAIFFVLFYQKAIKFKFVTDPHSGSFWPQRSYKKIVTEKKCERPSGKSCTDAFGTVHIRLEKMAAFHSENESNVWKNNNQQSIWICVKGQLGQGDHMVIMTKSFSKSFVSRKGFPPTLKRKTGVFKIPVWLAFSKSSVFVTD